MVPHPPKQALYKGIDEPVKPPPMENQLQDDERCCGTGTCLIDATGRCWCGQQWDGEKMCAPAPTAPEANQLPTTPPSHA
jgi:hypothetical protein